MGEKTKTTARMLIRHTRGRQFKQAIVSLFVGVSVYWIALWFVAASAKAKYRRASSYGSSSHHPGSGFRLPSFSASPKQFSRNSLSLTDQQCRDAFPGLMQSVDDVVKEGPFEVKDTGDLGPLQGRVKNGEIYVINAQRKSDLSAEMLNSRNAALHQLYRAIITSPEPIPDTVFSINFQDSPSSVGASIGYSRPADPKLRGGGAETGRRSFVMPHFSFWAWPLRHIPGGTFGEAAAAIDAVEAQYVNDHKESTRGRSTSSSGDGGSWSAKIPRAAWRGTAHFESALQPGLRRGLLKAAADKPWADVLPLNVTTALPIEGFCRYKYVVHTEGVAYSGRFQFLQMCRSVVLTPPLLWTQHASHLLRPVFSEDLLAVKPGKEEDVGRDGGGDYGPSRRWRERRSSAKPSPARKPSPATVERTRRSWPVRHPASGANIVFVAPDWSDLGATVAWLEAHPEVAEGIANRQRDLFVGGGYFSPAAETCYWRALIKGWSSVARVDDEVWAGKNGVRFEVFSLNNEL